MKTLIVTAIALLTLAISAAEAPQPAKKKRSGKEIMDRIAMKYYGGKIRQPNSEKGEIVFVNTQKTVEPQVLDKVIAKLERQFKFIFKVSPTDVESSTSRPVIRLEDLDRKSRVILAPEDLWVSLNVKSLAADNPPKAILNDRFEKEVRRVFAFVCGGTCGTNPGGVCKLVTRLADLDSIPGTDYSLDVEARIVNNMTDTEVRPYRIAKYSEACREGWAPAPTNEFQKAIWDRAQSDKERGPTKPITIPPPAAKQ